MSHAVLMAMFEAKQAAGEACGVELVWRNSDIAGSFVFEQATKLSVMLNCNRQTVDHKGDNGVEAAACVGVSPDINIQVEIDHASMVGRRYTNFGLYIPKLVGALQAAAISVDLITLSEWG